MNIDLSEIKNRLKYFAKIPSFAARHFWVSIGLIFTVSLVVAAFFFYQYAVLLPQKMMSNSHDLFQVEKSSYERLMDFREKEKIKEEKFFPDPFKLPGKKAEEELIE